MGDFRPLIGNFPKRFYVPALGIGGIKDHDLAGVVNINLGPNRDHRPGFKGCGRRLENIDPRGPEGGFLEGLEVLGAPVQDRLGRQQIDMGQRGTCQQKP